MILFSQLQPGFPTRTPKVQKNISSAATDKEKGRNMGAHRGSISLGKKIVQAQSLNKH